MTTEEKDFIATQFKQIEDKIDLLIDPVKEQVSCLKDIVVTHAAEINSLKISNEGHKEFHKAEVENKKDRRTDRRFYWEILVAGAGIIIQQYLHNGGI